MLRSPDKLEARGEYEVSAGGYLQDFIYFHPEFTELDQIFHVNLTRVKDL